MDSVMLQELKPGKVLRHIRRIPWKRSSAKLLLRLSQYKLELKPGPARLAVIQEIWAARLQCTRHRTMFFVSPMLMLMAALAVTLTHL